MGVSATETTTPVRAGRPRALWALAVANLVANIGIVVTGGAVRLTASGLGCPTWPRCTDRSFVPHGELGVHGVIEFGNRTLTFVLAAIAVACWVAALLALVRTWRGDQRGDQQGDQRGDQQGDRDWAPFVLSTVVALGVPAQAVVGGITVLTDLNPWIVAFHLLVSLAMIGVCVWLLDVLRGPAREPAGGGVRSLGWLVFAVGWAVLYAGTVVTGSGPHAGDLDSPRNGLDPVHVSQLHADVVFLFVGLTVGMVYAAPRAARRPVLVLLGLQVAQSLVGFVQFFTDLPIILVGIHLLGAALISAAMSWVVLRLHARGSVGAHPSGTVASSR
jgi:cytochrome c oxidase assembly protein subunit 15